MMSLGSTKTKIRIAIYRTSSLGDVALASACLQYLSQIALDTEVIWIGRGQSLEVLAKSYPNLRTFDSSRHKPIAPEAVAEEVKMLHLVVDLQAHLRSARFCRKLARLVDAKLVTAPKSRVSRSLLVAKSFLRRRKSPSPKFDPLSPSYEPQYLSMVATLQAGLQLVVGKDTAAIEAKSAIRPHLKIDRKTNANSWEKELGFGTWMAVAVGAAYETKQAPLSVVTQVLEAIQALDRDSRLQFLFVGDERDRTRVLELLSKTKIQGASLNLAGKLSLAETTRALSYAKVLLCNDSAVLHLAEAVNTPVVALFGPTHELFGFAPHMTESLAASTSIGCRPCSKHGKTPCRFEDMKCFFDIDTNAVVEHAGRLLFTS